MRTRASRNSAADSPDCTGNSAATNSHKRRIIQVALATAALSFAIFGVYLVRIELQFRQARDSADQVKERVDSGGDLELTAGDLDLLTGDLTVLERDLIELERRIDTPVLGSIARHSPIVGKQIRSSEELLHIGTDLVALAAEATEIGDEIRLALDAQGLRAGEQATGPTWLDVFILHQERIDELRAGFAELAGRREALNEGDLPERSANILGDVDQLLARGTRLDAEYASLLPLVESGLGGAGPTRFLLLLQNAQEIRPGGGFIGMYALVTVEKGQLAEYRIGDIKELDQDYVDRRESPQAAPAPIQEYLGQDEWLPHDANWSTDFPATARLVMSMYQQTTWPEIDAVVAINYSVIEEILRLTGPIETTVDGESVMLDDGSVIEFIESFRADFRHKDVVSELGSVMIESVISAEFDTKRGILFALRDLANAREIQAYFTDPDLQSETVRRGWAGVAHPAPAIPQLAVNLASVAGGKASVHLVLSSTLRFTGDEGIEQLTWEVTASHTGDPDGDPKHHGFHLTWLEVEVPEGAHVTSVSGDPVSTTLLEGRNVIAFVTGLVQGDRFDVVLTFAFDSPAEALYFRRQSGANDLTLKISGQVAGCSLSDQWMRLRSDEILDLSSCETRLAREAPGDPAQ